MEQNKTVVGLFTKILYGNARLFATYGVTRKTKTKLSPMDVFCYLLQRRDSPTKSSNEVMPSQDESGDFL